MGDPRYFDRNTGISADLNSNLAGFLIGWNYATAKAASDQSIVDHYDRANDEIRAARDALIIRLSDSNPEWPGEYGVNGAAIGCGWMQLPLVELLGPRESEWVAAANRYNHEINRVMGKFVGRSSALRALLRDSGLERVVPSFGNFLAELERTTELTVKWVAMIPEGIRVANELSRTQVASRESLEDCSRAIPDVLQERFSDLADELEQSMGRYDAWLAEFGEAWRSEILQWRADPIAFMKQMPSATLNVMKQLTPLETSVMNLADDIAKFEARVLKLRQFDAM